MEDVPRMDALVADEMALKCGGDEDNPVDMGGRRLDLVLGAEVALVTLKGAGVGVCGQVLVERGLDGEAPPALATRKGALARVAPPVRDEVGLGSTAVVAVRAAKRPLVRCKPESPLHNRLGHRSLERRLCFMRCVRIIWMRSAL